MSEHSAIGAIKEKLEELRRLLPGQKALIEELERQAETAEASPPSVQEPPVEELLKPQVPKAWEVIKLARANDRPHGLQFITAMTERFIELHGDRAFGDDAAIVGGVAMFRGRPVTIICTEKGRSIGQKIKRNFGMPHPEGYRKAMRLMEQAERFGRPVICLIDTSGAYCGIGAEERGQGQAIAWNLQRMGTLRVPVVSVIIGEGFSGGALALGVCDRLLMLQNSVYSIITPEGCASILYKDAKQASQAAGFLKMTAEDLHGLGICDGIIAEPAEGLRHANLAEVAGPLGDAVQAALDELCELDPSTLLERRYGRYRAVGRQDDCV